MDIVLGFMSVICFANAIHCKKENDRLKRCKTKTTGIVIDHVWKRRSRRAVISFQVFGQDFTVLSHIGATWVIEPLGKKVDVLYEIGNPRNATSNLNHSFVFGEIIVYFYVLIGFGLGALAFFI